MARKTRLSAAEIEQYRAEGLVVPDYRLPDDQLAALRVMVDRLIADHPNVAPEALSGPHNPWGQSSALKGSFDFLAFCQSPELLDMIEQLVGPDVILWGSQMFCKPPGVGKIVPWHQDGKYWPLQPLATVTLRIAIDGSTPENGCMRFIPGSHLRAELRAHEVVKHDDYALGQEMPDVDESVARDVVLEPGQISLHDVYTVHGSAANRSSKRRADYAIRYMPATTLYDRSPQNPAVRYAVQHSPHMNYPMRPIWLVRGVDRAGNDFAVGKGPGSGSAG
ncbi:MAG: phytanoyl-CoA dioxygenase family protein [Burkholderiaceae bacterium]